ncbi:beta-propeller fold lactonase family protein [Streptomyces sp. NPDC001292]|uniref:YncE family protein n=1 Tax=Streptomyces sp. NPDC001292 TaxID=3364558 RepID=UPI003699587B
MTTHHGTDVPMDRLFARAEEKGLHGRRVSAEAPPPAASVPKRLPAGQSPHSLAVSADETRLYVTNFQPGTVSVVDISSETVIATTHATEGPYGVALSPTGRRLHVAGPSRNALVDIQLPQLLSTDSHFGHSPYGVAAGADARVYLTLALEDSVLVTDAFAKPVFAVIQRIDFPTGVAVSPDETRLYVTNYFSDSVSVVDLSSETVIDTIPLSEGPYGVAVSRDGARLYVAHFPFDSVSVIDTSSLAVIDTIPVADGPRGVAVNQDGTRLYVTNFFANSVSVISL